MTTADDIRKFGFRRWYERALIESHVYLVTAFLGMIATFAGIELIGQRDGALRALLGFAATAIGTAIALYGVRRYYRLIMVAEALGDHATCKQCNTYGVFAVIAAATEYSRGDGEAEDSGAAWLKVRCRKCNHEWTI